MTYRKTWFDYVLWAAYAGLCVALLAYVGKHIYVFYVGTSLAKLGTFLPFPLILCLYPGIRLSSQAVRKKHHLSAHTVAMAESLVVSVSFVFGLIIRLREAFFMMSVPQTGEYYEMAVVRTGAPGPALAHGMSDLFVRALRIVFSFLGNGMMAAFLFQIFLQLLTLLFAYLAVKRAAGRFAACTVLLLLAFSDTFISKIFVIDPECMLLAVMMAGLCLVFHFVQAALCGGSGFGSLQGAVILGVILGVLCYLDCSMAILFLFLAGLFTGKMNGNGGRKRLAGRLLLVLAGSAAGFLCAIGTDALSGGVSFYKGFLSWIGPYLNFGMGARIFSVIGMAYPFFALLFILASFLVFEFLRGGREQDFSLWLLPCVLLSPVFLMDFSIVGLGGVVLFLWSVLAALGLKNAVFGGKVEALREKIEEINAAAAPIPALAAPAAASVPAAAPAEKPRFIENPLPLPKKHVKREMDYDYEVAETDMHYQVEIARGDDFDF